MDYGQIIKQAWEIAWKRRYLWLFGLVTGLGGGGSFPGGGDNLKNNEAVASAVSWFTEHPGIILAVVLIGGLLLLIHIILVFISYGALIRSVAEIARQGQSNFDSALNAGLKYFWRNVGISLVIGFYAVMLMGVVLVPSILAIVAGSTSAKIFGVIWLVLWILPGLAALFVMVLVSAYAARFCVAEDQGVMQSLTSGWKMFRSNLSESIILGAIAMGLGMAVSIGLVITIIIIAIPFIILGIINLWLGVIPGGLVFLVFLILFSCIYGVFSSAFWTLGFLKLLDKQKPPLPIAETMPPNGINPDAQPAA
jgi:hypothetical protein